MKPRVAADVRDMASIITFTSDFGCADPYVAAVKGVMKGIAPQAEIIDITHEVPPADVLAGGLALANAAAFFPEGTVHLAVVDPGVGGSRRIVAAQAGAQFFVAPDNGLLCRACERAQGTRLVYVEAPAYRRSRVSSTFHARDIMGPSAAHIAAGTPIERLGPPAPGLVPDGWEAPQRFRGGLVRGKVVSIDRFGNCITNMGEDDLTAFAGNAIVTAGEADLTLVTTYSDALVARPLACIGSFGHLEIAVNRGSAARMLKLSVGDAVSVRKGS